MQPTQKKKGNGIPFSFIYIVIPLVIFGLYYSFNSSTSKEVNWTEFEKIALSGDIEKIDIYTNNHRAEGVLTSRGAKKQKVGNPNGGDSRISTNYPDGDIQSRIDAWNAALSKNGKSQITIKYNDESLFMKIVMFFGPVVLLFFLFYILSRRMTGSSGGGMFNVGKSRAKLFDKNNSSKVTFKDVAGLADAKIEIQEIVEFLKNPSRFTELGAKIPKGALLVGPPGTGKTLLAKAVAGEANVPFLSMSGSDFVEMFVGVGAARVRDLFKQAKEKAPCIVFIDEIDSVGRARGKNPNMGSNDERENTLNQLLTEMDGFGGNSGVIILAATNRADMLDPALLRPGRFDRQIGVDLPELTDRIDIFNVHLRNIKVNSNLDIEQLSRQTAGFSGADIANVCNEAALIAARNNKTDVDINDFRSAIDRIVAGLEKKSLLFTNEEKNAVATHEAGHAVVSWMLRYGTPLVKVTIVPRGKAAGYAMYEPEERAYTPIDAVLDEICSLLGGRAAEEIFIGQIGLGAFNDLERATKMALALVVYYGASDKLKNINYHDESGQSYGFTKPYSEQTARIIDEEIARIINEQYLKAKELLKQYSAEHNQIRDLLIKNEVLYNDDVKQILGQRKWKSRTDEVIEIHEQRKIQNEDSELNSQNIGQDNRLADANSDDSDVGTPPPFNK